VDINRLHGRIDALDRALMTAPIGAAGRGIVSVLSDVKLGKPGCVAKDHHTSELSPSSKICRCLDYYDMHPLGHLPT